MVYFSDKLSGKKKKIKKMSAVYKGISLFLDFLLLLRVMISSVTSQ